MPGPIMPYAGKRSPNARNTALTQPVSLLEKIDQSDGNKNGLKSNLNVYRRRVDKLWEREDGGGQGRGAVGVDGGGWGGE